MVQKPTVDSACRDVLQAVTVFIFPGLLFFITTPNFHIRLRCSAINRLRYHNGKYNGPTLVFQVFVDHTRRIVSVGPGYNGCRADKTIAQTDDFIQGIHARGMYADRTFNLYTGRKSPDGNWEQKQWSGFYTITDAGTHGYDCSTMHHAQVTTSGAAHKSVHVVACTRLHFMFSFRSRHGITMQI